MRRFFIKMKYFFINLYWYERYIKLKNEYRDLLLQVDPEIWR